MIDVENFDNLDNLNMLGEELLEQGHSSLEIREILDRTRQRLQQRRDPKKDEIIEEGSYSSSHQSDQSSNSKQSEHSKSVASSMYGGGGPDEMMSEASSVPDRWTPSDVESEHIETFTRTKKSSLNKHQESNKQEKTRFQNLDEVVGDQAELIQTVVSHIDRLIKKDEIEDEDMQIDTASLKLTKRQSSIAGRAMFQANTKTVSFRSELVEFKKSFKNNAVKV